MNNQANILFCPDKNTEQETKTCELEDTFRRQEGCTDFFFSLTLPLVIIAGRKTLMDIASTGRQKCLQSLELIYKCNCYLHFDGNCKQTNFLWLKWATSKAEFYKQQVLKFDLIISNNLWEKSVII